MWQGSCIHPVAGEDSSHVCCNWCYMSWWNLNMSRWHHLLQVAHWWIWVLSYATGCVLLWWCPLLPQRIHMWRCCGYMWQARCIHPLAGEDSSEVCCNWCYVSWWNLNMSRWHHLLQVAHWWIWVLSYATGCVLLWWCPLLPQRIHMWRCCGYMWQARCIHPLAGEDCSEVCCNWCYMSWWNLNMSRWHHLLQVAHWWIWVLSYAWGRYSKCLGTIFCKGCCVSYIVFFVPLLKRLSRGHPKWYLFEK